MSLTSCLPISWSLNCKTVGGVQEVYYATWNGPLFTYSVDGTGVIGTFSGATTSFYKLSQPIKFGTWASTVTSTAENGTVGWKNSTSIVLHNSSQTMSNILDILSRGRWRVMVLTQTGKYFLLNTQNPADVTTGAYGAGKLTTDLNGSTLTFESEDVYPATEVSLAAALSVISGS